MPETKTLAERIRAEKPAEHAVGESDCTRGYRRGLLDAYERAAALAEAAEGAGAEPEKLSFVDALKIAQDVLETYKADQPKWWKRMDGTPILNDVAVRMATAFLPRSRPAAPARAPGAAVAG